MLCAKPKCDRPAIGYVVWNNIFVIGCGLHINGVLDDVPTAKVGLLETNKVKEKK